MERAQMNNLGDIVFMSEMFQSEVGVRGGRLSDGKTGMLLCLHDKNRQLALGQNRSQHSAAQATSENNYVVLRRFSHVDKPPFGSQPARSSQCAAWDCPFSTKTIVS